VALAAVVAAIAFVAMSSGGDSPAAALLQTAAAEALAAIAAGDGPRLARQHAAITAARARLTAERAGG
jgi:hypothetical protein